MEAVEEEDLEEALEAASVVEPEAVSEAAAAVDSEAVVVSSNTFFTQTRVH